MANQAGSLLSQLCCTTAKSGKGPGGAIPAASTGNIRRVSVSGSCRNSSAAGWAVYF